ncbi:MAG TPA: inorganic diphosphatase [Vicinamibacteria bacterium]
MSLPPAFHKDGSLNVMVESPRGSSLKLKYDLDQGLMTLSRPLPAGLVYPCDWGFISSTRAADGDPLDAWIAWEQSSYPGMVVPCRLLGMLKVEQKNLEHGGRERNDRLAVLPMKAPRLEHLRSVFDLAERLRAEIEQFFLHAVAFEGKELKLLGWEGPAEAEAVVREAVQRFRG